MGAAAVTAAAMAEEELGSRGPCVEKEDITWTNTTLLHRLVVCEDIDTLRRRKAEITSEIVNLTCEFEYLTEVTPLFLATYIGNLDFVKVFLGAGADPNLVAVKGSEDSSSDSEGEGIPGWDAFKVQWSPLYWAVISYKAEIVRELLQAGARVSVGCSPMKEIEKRPGMDPEIKKMVEEAMKLEEEANSLQAPGLD